MANSVAIPQEIIDNIIEVVGNDRYLLKHCALVSSSFLLPSRKRLFSKIVLRDDQACQRLYQILIENPVIQSFVRSFVITGYETFKSHSLIAILRLPFRCLENFFVGNGRPRSYWYDFSRELKDALSTVILSPTLKTLYINGYSVSNTRVEVLNHLYGEQSRSSAASEGMTTTASHTVIDQCMEILWIMA